MAAATASGSRNGHSNMWALTLIVLALMVELIFFSYSWLKEPRFKKNKVNKGGSVRSHTGLRQHQNETRLEGEQAGSNTCTVYMAESSVVGISSMGIYTTKSLSKQDVIVRAIDGLSIPVIDYYKAPSDEPSSVQRARQAWMSEFGEYWWGRGVADQLKLEGDHAVDFKITFSELPNHHCILESLNIKNPSYRAYNDGLLKNRSTDPGVGAFSYHMGRKVSVKRDVQAGEELFLNYGHCGPLDGSSPDWSRYIARYDDFDVASKVVRNTWEELSAIKRTDAKGEEGREAQIALFDTIVYNVSTQVKEYNEKAAKLLPTTYESLKQVMRKLPLRAEKEIQIRLARDIGTTPRTVEWIRENGMCVDTIAPRPSKILNHAGQGAFAKHTVAKGEVIVPAPMLHITDKEALRMNVNTDEPDVKPYQLLMNYCFGHHESSLLLCPITNAMLINHCSHERKQECGGRGPNAEYRWASGWDSNKTNSFLEMSLEDLEQSRDRGLSLEVYATRDIMEGEEIFMDYGRRWEQAWDDHVASWSPPMGDEVFRSYVSPTELNEKEESLELLVSHDLRKIVEHTNLFTGCIFQPTQFDWDNEAWWEGGHNQESWMKLTDNKILQRYATDDGSRFSSDYEDSFDGAYWPCAVIGEDSGSDTYTVRILQSNFRPETKWYKEGLPRFVTNFPRRSIRYFNKPYTSDQHLFRAFRQPVEFRDDLFPDQWRNLKR